MSCTGRAEEDGAAGEGPKGGRRSGQREGVGVWKDRCVCCRWLGGLSCAWNCRLRCVRKAGGAAGAGGGAACAGYIQHGTPLHAAPHGVRPNGVLRRVGSWPGAAWEPMVDMSLLLQAAVPSRIWARRCFGKPMLDMFPVAASCCAESDLGRAPHGNPCLTCRCCCKLLRQVGSGPGAALGNPCLTRCCWR